MSSIFGAISKKGTLSSEIVKELILSHRFRGPDGWGAVFDGRVERHQSYGELEKAELEAEQLVGHALLRTANEELQPVSLDGSFICFDGWFSAPLLERIGEGGIFNAVRGVDGEHSLSYFEKGKLTLFRDPVGARALFYGVSKNLFAFSSLKQPLQKLGIKNISSLKPGNTLTYSGGKVKAESCKSLPQPLFSLELTPKVKEELKEAIVHSVERRASGLRRAGVLFSAGLDSGLIAWVAREFNPNLFLYCVGTEESEDVRYAQKFGDEVGFEVKTILLDEQQLIDYYQKICSLLPDAELMRVELAIPVFISSENAKKDGVRVLLSGQGAEELFAGYERHVECWREGGDLGRMLFEELRALHSKDLESNEYVASLNQCELRYPFLDVDVIRSATSIKPELNLKEGKKAVLREVSKELGLPKEVAERPKKAVQYGSGIHRLLLKALRKMNKVKITS